MNESQDPPHETPPRFLRLLQMLLGVQVIFNFILYGWSTLSSFRFPIAFDPGSCVCGAFLWGVAGVYSLLFLIDILKPPARHGKVARSMGYAVFGAQAVEYFIGLMLIIMISQGPADGGFPLVVVGFGLLLAIACFIALWMYATANPLPAQRLPEPPPEPEEIETSGDWDEAKNPKEGESGSQRSRGDE